MLPEVRFRVVQGQGGIRLRVALAGTGPLVLMVHGFPESWISWRHQIPAIAAAGYTAAAMETRGYGESDKPAEATAYTIREMAGDIAAVTDALDPRGAVLIGHDWGAAQVYGAALLHREKVLGLVGLAFTAGAFVDRKPSEMWAEYYPDQNFYQSYFKEPGVAEAEFEADPRGFVRRFLYSLAGERPDEVNGLIRPVGTKHLLDGLPDPDPFPNWLGTEEIEYYAASFARGGLRGPINRYRAQDLDVEQLRPYAKQAIEPPAMYIGGARDPARYLVPGFDRYVDPIPRCADQRGVHVLAGIGHWIQQEAPDVVNGLILGFLRELAAEGRLPRTGGGKA